MVGLGGRGVRNNMSEEVYIFPISGYMAGRRLLPSAIDAIGRLIGGDHSVSGLGAYVVARYLLLKGLITETRYLRGGWRVESQHAVTDAGRVFYEQHATWDC